MANHPLDHPLVLSAIYHPRPDLSPPPSESHISDYLVAVQDDVHLHLRCHLASSKGTTILLFHGNGEIVSDYDALGSLYNNLGINLVVTDYRGYGRSTGRPSVSAMLADSHVILEYIQNWKRENSCSGPLLVMGRSLGSACALELAARHASRIDGLIIESGFAYAVPLLQLLGIDTDQLDFDEADGFSNLVKIRGYRGPTLIIHAEFDHIIPFSDGLALFESSPAGDKILLKIENANHNDIFMRGMERYLGAIENLIRRIRSSPS